MKKYLCSACGEAENCDVHCIVETELGMPMYCPFVKQEDCEWRPLKLDRLQAELQKYIAVATYADCFVDLKPEHRLYHSIRKDLKDSIKAVRGDE